ncbi:Nn.00g108770.m01.CDS01 [Neocucurbitaria sp. VM-36]
MAPHILRLPGELRNRIYKFALFEEKGLYYRLDKSGVGWLCLRSTEVAAGRDMEGGMTEIRKDTEDVERATKRLNIVDEKGNQNALGAEKQTSDGSMVTIKGQTIANQLQFVNWQLRNETRALGIRYNTLVFQCTTPEASSAFFDTLSKLKKDKIRMMILNLDENEHDPRMIVPFAKLCGAHPRSSARIYCLCACLDDSASFLKSAIMISHTTGSDNSFAIKTSNNLAVLQMVMRTIKKHPEHHLWSTPSNIRIFPRDEPFDEAVFRASCEEGFLARDVIIPRLDGGMDTLIALARDWSENGF